ncbi:MAG: hypothetical protein WCE62_08390 [Polyangiales bacterium]
MMRRLWWVSFWLLVLGCDESITPKQINEPCTRTSQCVLGLSCLAGVCTAPNDGGVDGGTDGGTDAAVATGL